MKWKLILILFLYIGGQALAQNKIDSLKSVLNSGSDQDRLLVLNQLSWELKFSDPAQAKEYGQSAVKLAQKLNNKEQEAKANYHLGVAHSISSEFPLSNSFAEQAIDVYRSIDDVAGIGRCLNLQGINEQSRGNYEQALSHYQKALDVFELLADSAYVLKIKGNIGNVNYLRGSFEEAAQAYEDLVDFSRKKKDTVTLANNLANVGRCFNSIGYYDQALPAFFEAADLFKKTNNIHGLANLYNDLGILFYTVKMYPESLEKYNESHDLFQQIGNELQIGQGYNNLGKLYNVLEQYDTALAYYQKALDLYEANNMNRKGEILTNMGEIKYKLGDNQAARILFEEALKIDTDLKSKNSIAHNKAWLGVIELSDSSLLASEKLLQEAHQEWTALGQMNGLLMASRHLAELYEAKGDYKTALKYQTENELLEDSIFNVEQQVELMRVMVQQNLKEQEQALLSSQRVSPDPNKGALKSWQLFSLIAIIALGILIFSWLRIQKVRRNLQTKLHAKDQDLQSLKSERENLASALEKKNQEVVFLSLSTIQKDNFIKQFSKQLKEVSTQFPQNKSLQKLSSLLYFNQIQQQDWERFKSAFEQISPGFFDKLFEISPNLSNKELRHCALIRLKFSSKDIAEILGISMSGVHKARYRLRKQLGLSREQNLETFLTSI